VHYLRPQPADNSSGVRHVSLTNRGFFRVHRGTGARRRELGTFAHMPTAAAVARASDLDPTLKDAAGVRAWLDAMRTVDAVEAWLARVHRQDAPPTRPPPVDDLVDATETRSEEDTPMPSVSLDLSWADVPPALKGELRGHMDDLADANHPTGVRHVIRSKKRHCYRVQRWAKHRQTNVHLALCTDLLVAALVSAASTVDASLVAGGHRAVDAWMRRMVEGGDAAVAAWATKTVTARA
jgi:hypothetical protein